MRHLTRGEGRLTGVGCIVEHHIAERARHHHRVSAGCRGLRLGGAQVSEKHANFLINTGEASAADIEALGEEVRRRVLEKTGVRLDWEIRRIGEML